MVTPLAFPPQGRPGAQGPSGDFGYIRYGEMTGLPSTEMPAFLEMPFVLTQPRVMADFLKPPFVGHAFLDAAGILRPRKAGDSYLPSLRMSVTPEVIGGWIEINVYVTNNIAGVTGSIATARFDLSGQAGTEDRPNLTLQLFPAAGFVANGAYIRMRSSVPVFVTNEVIFITPQGAA